MAEVPHNLKLIMAQAFFLAANDYKMSLHTSELVPNPETHEYYSDLTNEVAGTGYTAGGDDIGDPTVALNDNKDAVVDWADYTFTNLTVAEIRYAAIYKDTGTPTTSPVIAILDFGQNEAPSGIDFVVKISVHGVLDVT